MSPPSENSTILSCTPTEKAIDASFVCCGSILGTIANTLIILTPVFVKSMRKSMYWLILNVAIADLVVCGYIMPNVAINRLACGNQTGEIACNVNAFTIFMCAGVSNFSFMSIAINRRMFVLRSPWYETFFGGKKMALIIIGIWLCWALMTLMPQLTNSFHFIDEAYVCFYYDSLGPFWVSFILSVLAVGLPTFISAGCYINILKVMHDTRKRLEANKNRGQNEGRSLTPQERQTVISAVIAFVFFNLCWGPYSIHLYFDKFGLPVPPDIHRVVLWLSIFNSACNPFVLIVTSSLYRRSIRKILCRGVAGVGPSSGTQRSEVQNTGSA